jgi:SNF2 family DNA or RNA helicase
MPVSIKIGPDGRIWADIPYAGGRGPKAAKRVPGVKPKYEKTPGSKKDKFLAWTYPLDMNSCRGLRQVFGKALRIETELADWARTEIAREQFMIELGKASDAPDFSVADIAPSLDEAISNRKFQRVGSKFIVEGKNVLIADQPGLGKTLMTLAGLLRAGARRIIVFAPRTALESVWAREIQRWTKGQAFVAVGTPTARRRAIEAATSRSLDAGPVRILICNPEMVRVKRTVECLINCDDDDECDYADTHVAHYDEKYPELFLREWDAAVVDECHRALIGKNVMSKKVSQTRRGMMYLPIAKDGVRVALSGTPYRGKQELLWGILNWLRPDVFTSFWRWVETFFEVDKDEYGGRHIGDMKPEMAEAYDAALAPFVLRRTKAEVAKDLPPKMYGGTPLDPDDPDSALGVWLEMEPAQAKIYEQMRAESFVALDGGSVDAIGHLPMMTRLHQFAICSWTVDNGIMVPDPLPSNKYNWLLEKLEQWEENGTKVVIASQYTKVINAFAAQLEEDGYPNYILTGETKQADRARIVEEFQSDPDSPKVFLINTNAGGVAITLDAADDLVFLDETYIPDDQEQVEDRVHRLSRIHNVTIWKLCSLGSIEEAIASTTEFREGKVKERLDGSRGVEFAKKMLEKLQ